MGRRAATAAGIIAALVLLAGIFGYFAPPPPRSREVASPSAAAAEDRAMHFSIESAWLSDMFKDDLKVAKVQAAVHGGTPREWAATAIVIAEAVASYGADSVEVSVTRDDIHQQRGERFREIAHVYFSPKPERSLWDEKTPWTIFMADADRLSTQTDVSVTEEFDALDQKYIAAGLSTEAAERKAAAIVAKKFKLPKDWTLPLGNAVVKGSGISKEAFNVKPDAARESLEKLSRCMKGKIIRTTTTCFESSQS
jgi:hypothetical protein